MARDCKASVRCYKCNYQHHVSLCNRDPKLAISKPGLKVKVKEFVPRENESSQPNSPPPPETETVHTEQILQLITMRFSCKQHRPISQPQIMKEMRKTLEFCLTGGGGGGSQRTYVTKQLKTTLNLPIIRSENLVIKIFGTDNVEMKQCDAVKLVLKK